MLLPQVGMSCLMSMMLIGRSPSGDSPAVVRWIACIVAALTLLLCGWNVIQAIDAHLTGTATYRYGPRGMLREQVHRDTQPEKFQEAVSRLCFTGATTGLISIVSFWFFRKLGE